jgi:hypothetical protein
MARRHAPLRVVIHGRDECSVCGRLVIGHGPTLRHEGEAVAVLTPAPEDAASVERIMEVARAVAARMRGASEHDIAQAVAQELYGEGLIRRSRGPRRGNVVLVDDEGPREPDFAERAAGVRVPA